MIENASMDSSYLVLGLRGQALGSSSVVIGKPVILAFL